MLVYLSAYLGNFLMLYLGKTHIPLLANFIDVLWVGSNFKKNNTITKEQKGARLNPGSPVSPKQAVAGLDRMIHGSSIPNPTV